MNVETLSIRNMTVDDLDFAFSLTRAEGWLTETRESFQSFLEYDSEGTFIAEFGHHPVGICVGVAYKTFGFLGELIVIPEFRGRGFGRNLFEHTMDFFHSRRIGSVILHGDEPAVPIYEKAGFGKVCRAVNYLGQAEPMSCSVSIRPMKREDLEAVFELDLRAFGADRSVFLHRFLMSASEHCFVEMDEVGNIAGFITGRRGNGVTAAGPWVAGDNSRCAADLLKAFSDSVHPDVMRIDLLEDQVRAIGILNREFPFLQENGHSWKMIRGDNRRWGLPELALAVGTPATG